MESLGCDPLVWKMLVGIPRVESPTGGFQAQSGDRRVDYRSEGVFDVVAIQKGFEQSQFEVRVDNH